MSTCPACQSTEHSNTDERGVASCGQCQTMFIGGPGSAGDGSACGMRLERTASTFTVSQKQNGVRLYSLLANIGFFGVAGMDGLTGLELAVAGTIGVLTAPMLFSRTSFVLSSSAFEVRQGPVALVPNLFGPRRPPRALKVDKESDLEGTTWAFKGLFDDSPDASENGWRVIHEFTNERCATFTLRSLHDAIESYALAPAPIPASRVLSGRSGAPVAVR